MGDHYCLECVHFLVFTPPIGVCLQYCSQMVLPQNCLLRSLISPPFVFTYSIIHYLCLLDATIHCMCLLTLLSSIYVSLQYYPLFVFTYSTIHNLCSLTVLYTICVYLQYYPLFVFTYSTIHNLCSLTVLSTVCVYFSTIHFCVCIQHYLLAILYLFAVLSMEYLCSPARFSTICDVQCLCLLVVLSTICVSLQHCVWLCWRSLRVYAP